MRELTGASRVFAVTGWRRAGAAFIAGAISTLALAPLHLWPVMFATLPVLVWLIDGVVARASGLMPCFRAAAVCGWWFGFGYFFAGLYWIGFAFFVEAEKFAWLAPLGVLAMPAGLALFFALAVAMASLAWSSGPARIVTLALAFFIAEWARGHVLTGLPWNTIGYTLAAPDVLMQSAALVGVYGLSFFAVLIFAAPATLTEPSSRSAKYVMPGIAVLLIAASAAWGLWRQSEAVPPDVSGPKLRLVQANIPQAEKWNPDARDWIFERYLGLSRGGDNTLKTTGISHIIWPEAALPFVYLFDDQIAKSSWQQSFDELLPAGTMLITGANRAETVPGKDDERIVSDVYNSVLALDERGVVTEKVDKAHLVPFGEYLPFQKTLESIGVRQLTNLPGGFTAGARVQNIDLAGLPVFTPLICYEIIFPGAVTPAERPAWLLNVTDDSWFGETAGPYQHLHQARLRAVEEGLPVIRVANTGISAVIGPRGQLRQIIPLGTMGSADTAIPGAVEPPLYARLGNRLLWTILLIGCCLCFAMRNLTEPRKVSNNR